MSKAQSVLLSIWSNRNILHHYNIVRRDLSLGQICAQLTHSSGESFGKQHSNVIIHAVVLGVSDEYELLFLERTLTDAGIKFKAIREPDLNNQLTAIGINPIKKNLVYQFVKRFKLIS